MSQDTILVALILLTGGVGLSFGAFLGVFAARKRG